MLSRQFITAGVAALVLTLNGLASAQEGAVVPPRQGETATSALADIQTKVDKIQTLKATMEFDRKDDDDPKKKNKSKKNKKKAQGDSEADGPNPKWPEPVGRDVERGPLEISRGIGARVYLERKEEKEIFVANSTSLCKHDIDDKEAKLIPTTWPVIDTFVTNAFKMNVLVAMEPGSIKLKGTQTVDGAPCYVLEGQSPSKLSMLGVDEVKLKMWISTTDGVPRLISVSGEDDTKIRLKNVELNAPVSADRFQYTPPSGVKTENIFGF